MGCVFPERWRAPTPNKFGSCHRDAATAHDNTGQNQNLGASKLIGPCVRAAFGGICLRKSRRDASGTKPVRARILAPVQCALSRAHSGSQTVSAVPLRGYEIPAGT